MGKIIMSGIVNPLVAPSNLPPIGTALNDMTWEQISVISNAGVATNYFSIGDVKEVVLNGSVGNGLTFSNTKAYMQILAFDHNKDVEMNGDSHIVFGFGKSTLSGGKDICFVDSNYDNTSSSQYFNMNLDSINNGGWESSKMRTIICPAFKATLSDELQTVLKSRTIYSDNIANGTSTTSDVTATYDEIYIPAEYEVFGTRKYANSAEQSYQKQLTYYANGNSKIRYKHNDTNTVARWWIRSAYYSNKYAFCYVSTSGVVDYTNYSSSSLGFVPLITI